MNARFRDIPGWVWSLNRVERELLQLLVAAHPRILSFDYLTSGAVQTEGGKPMSFSYLAVAVSNLRRKLPAGGIEGVRGAGYRLTAEAAARL